MKRDTSDKRGSEWTCEWKRAGRRWGHRLHSMCSYMAMFPPTIPHYFIQRLTQPGDIVLDPFSGRGTTPLQACLEGRVGVGNDLNPLAYVLTAAKVDPPEGSELARRLDELEEAYSPPAHSRDLFQKYEDASAPFLRERKQDRATPDEEQWRHLRNLLVEMRSHYAGEGYPFAPYYRNEAYNCDPEKGEVDFSPELHHHPIWVFFHPETLRQLAYLKSELGWNRCDTFIAATILGIMHGNGRFFLSLPMPNTFSMTPRYVLKYAHQKRLVVPYRNVFDCVRRKVRLMGIPREMCRGIAIYGDVRDLRHNLEGLLPEARGVDLVVTSPPYLKVVKYGQYNWIRLWFLDDIKGPWAPLPLENDSTTLDRLIDERLDDGHRLPEYLQFMRDTLAVLFALLADHGTCALVIGDVIKGDERVLLAEEVWRHAARPAGFRLVARIDDEISDNRKVTRIWGDERGRTTPVDRVLVLAKKKPTIHRGPIDW